MTQLKENLIDSSNQTISSHLTKVPEMKLKGFILIQTNIKQGNLIKKVKTYTMSVYEKLLQSCLIAKKSFKLYNISNKRKRNLFKSFKADISRKRNSIIQSIPMKKIFKHLIGFNLMKLKVKKNKADLFNYLLNSSLEDIMKMIQRNQCPFAWNSNNTSRKIGYNDYKAYFTLIKEVDYSYKRKKNENDYYIKNYSENFNNINNSADTTHNDSFMLFIKHFKGFK